MCQELSMQHPIETAQQPCEGGAMIIPFYR